MSNNKHCRKNRKNHKNSSCMTGFSTCFATLRGLRDATISCLWLHGNGGVGLYFCLFRFCFPPPSFILPFAVFSRVFLGFFSNNWPPVCPHTSYFSSHHDFVHIDSQTFHHVSFLCFHPTVSSHHFISASPFSF